MRIHAKKTAAKTIRFDATLAMKRIVFAAVFPQFQPSAKLVTARLAGVRLSTVTIRGARKVFIRECRIA